MEKAEEAKLGYAEKPIAKDTYWFQYVVAFSGKNDKFGPNRVNYIV